MFHVIIASTQFEPSGPSLFSGEVSPKGMIVLGLLISVLILAACLALVGYLRERHLARLPAILGQPKELLDEVGDVLELTMSDKYLLSKLAYRLRLPQPVSLLICPLLLVRAARVWQNAHRLAPTRQWGLHRLNYLAEKIYKQDLSALAQQVERPRLTVPRAK